MSDSVSYFFDENFTKENKTEESKNVQEIKDLYKILTVEEKVVFRRFIINEPLF